MTITANRWRTRPLVFLVFLLLGIAGVSASTDQPPDPCEPLRMEVAKARLEVATLQAKLRKAEEWIAQLINADDLQRRAEKAEERVGTLEKDLAAARETATALEREKDELRRRLEQLEVRKTPAPDAAPRVAPAAGAWRLFEQTSIDGTVQQVNKGSIFKTLSGSLYEVVDFVFLFEFEFNPEVTVLTDGQFYKLIVKGIDEPLLCERVAGAPVRPAPEAPTATAAVIESRIDDAFEGFEFGKIFKLRNGQIWEQTSAKYRYRYKFAPRVTIWKDGAVHKMKVEGMDDTITVKRLK